MAVDCETERFTACHRDSLLIAEGRAAGSRRSERNGSATGQRCIRQTRQTLSTSCSSGARASVLLMGDRMLEMMPLPTHSPDVNLRYRCEAAAAGCVHVLQCADPNHVWQKQQDLLAVSMSALWTHCAMLRCHAIRSAPYHKVHTLHPVHAATGIAGPAAGRHRPLLRVAQVSEI